jgi:hypothetical protein
MYEPFVALDSIVTSSGIFEGYINKKSIYRYLKWWGLSSTLSRKEKPRSIKWEIFYSLDISGTQLGVIMKIIS